MTELNDDQKKQLEAHNQATSAFIDLANKLSKESGQDVKIVSAALMAASGIYATFIAAGNEGYLGPGGGDKGAQLYKNNLGDIQERKKAELKMQGKEARPLGESDTMITAPNAEALAKETGNGAKSD